MNESWDIEPGEKTAVPLDGPLHPRVREYLSMRPSGRVRSWLRWRFGSRQRFLWWLADWSHWAGWTNDETEVETATAWLSLHWVQLSCWRYGRTDVRDRALLRIFRLPAGFRLAVAAMWR